jgi:hypothetical protein
MSFQTILQNRTPFAADKLVVPDNDGQEAVLVVVSATFGGDANGALRLADEQPEIRVADECYGPPERGSVRYEADIALEKPFVDLVVVNGHAYAARERSAELVPVSITAGSIDKHLLVSGDRFWRRTLLGVVASSPRPFVTMPLVYERAFGGIDTSSPNASKHAAERRNMSGLGFRGVRSYDPAIETELPNVEYPKLRMTTLTDTPNPAGLGVVARSWMPRIAFAGTFGEQWQRDRWPLLPIDFDPRHYQAAPADQQSGEFAGGEIVTLVNLTPDGLWQFRLPAVQVPVHLLFDRRREVKRVRIDTISIEPDRRLVTVTGRVRVHTQRTRGLLREIVVGSATSGWLRARQARKRYIGSSKGELSPRPRYFHL